MPKQMISIQQAVNEIIADKKQCFQYAKRLVKSTIGHFSGSQLNRQRTNVFFRPLPWKSKRNNEFLILVDVSPKTDAKNTDIFLEAVMLFIFEGTLNAAILKNTNDSPNVEVYKYHFLKRYNEIFLKRPDISLGDIACIFVRANPYSSSVEIKSLKDKNCYAFFYPDGVGFGRYYAEKQYCIHFTFFTRTMLSEKHSDISEELQGLIGDIPNKAWDKIRFLNESSPPIQIL